jgi:hypothetical protein
MTLAVIATARVMPGTDEDIPCPTMTNLARPV